MQTLVTPEKSRASSLVNKKSQQPFFAPVIIQPKLTVGPADDPFEREADAMADKVMRMTDSDVISLKPAPDVIQKKCSSCEEEEKLHRKGTAVGAIPEVTPPVHQALQSTGQSLDHSSRLFMESRFGYDFSSVQIHNDSLAHQSSSDINALAYTHGNHIVFGAGQYQPNTDAGKKLMAHELTHVLHQSDPGTAKIQRDSPRYYSYTSADYAQQVKDALSETNSIAGVGNPAKAFTILNDIETPQLEEVLLLIGVDNLTILKDLQSPVHANSNRTEIFVKATRFSLLSKGDYNESEVYDLISHLGLLDTQQDTDLLNVIKRNTEFSKVFSKQQCIYNVINNIPQVSYELAQAPCADTSEERVSLWLKLNINYIIEAEKRFSIDRRAIAGAIAWEALKNIRFVTFSSVGPGKVHTKRHFYSYSHSDTVADQVEEAGYLPEQTVEMREALLAQPAGAITYIAAIMRAGADIAFKEGNFDISKDPAVLTWFYNSKDLPDWTELIKNKKRGSPFATDENKMAKWVSDNIAFLEKSVGQPAFNSPFATPAPVKKINKKSKEPTNAKSEAGKEVGSEYIVQQVLQASGQNMDKTTQSFMESRFGYDFSNVQIHTDSSAHQSSSQINALAYAHDNHIVFGDGQYQPHTDAGKKLLAHELTHVVQQANFNKPVISRQPDQDQDETQLQLLNISEDAAVYFDPLKVSLVFSVIEDDIKNGQAKNDTINDAFWTAFPVMDSKKINEENVPDQNERQFYVDAYLFIQNTVYPYVTQHSKIDIPAGNVAAVKKTEPATPAAKVSPPKKAGAGITGEALSLNGTKFYTQYEAELKNNFGSLASDEEIKYVVSQVVDKKNFHTDYDAYGSAKEPLTQGVYLLKHGAKNYIPNTPLTGYGKLKDKWGQYGITDKIWEELDSIKQKLIYPMLKFIVPRITSIEQLTNNTDVGNLVAQQSYNYLGVKYLLGGQLSSQDKNGLDCSGLVFQVYRDIGVKPKYGSGNGVDMLRTSPNFEVIDEAGILPGDLLLRSDKGGENWVHVGIYVGNNYLVEAPYTGTVVQKSVYKSDKWQLIVRFKP